MTTTLSVASFNIGPAKSTDLDMLADLAAVLGFQEGSDQKATLKAFTNAHPGWRLVVGWRPGAAAVPVLVNTTVVGEPVKVTFHRAVGRRWVGPVGKGPTFSKPKWITHVELADGVHVLNTHMIPSATKSRKALGTKEWEARRKHYRDHIAAIVAVVEACEGPVVLTLDMNAPPDFDLVQPLRDVGFTGWTTEPTIHGEPIDHVVHLKDPKFIETAQMVLNTTSDHKAVVAAFEHTPQEAPVSLFPGATWRPIPRYQPGGASGGEMTNPRRLVLHTAVSNGDSLFDQFNKSGNPVAHFYVDKVGHVEQYVSCDRRASAVLDGNHDCITVETWDGFRSSWDGGSPGPDWTPEQVETLAQIAAWCHDEHQIDMVQLTSSKAGLSGVGWHRLGCDGNYEEPPGNLLGGRVPDGEHWSTSFGKVCPTTTRIHQVVEEVIPRAIAITQGEVVAISDDDLKKIRAIVADETAKAVRVQIDDALIADPTGEKHAWSLATLLWNIKRVVDKLSVPPPPVP